MGAHICGVLEPQCGELAFLCECGSDRSQTVARCRHGGEMLGAIFNPFDWHARLAADRGHKNNIGESSLLDPETPAAACCGDETKTVSGHTQCIGHERLHHKRPLEVRPYCVPVGGAFELRNDPQGLDRGGCVARKRVRELEDPIGDRKCSVRVAVAETASTYEVRSDVLVDHRGLA